MSITRASLLLPFLLAACTEPRPLASGDAGAADGSDLATCTACHGDPANGNAAPPPAPEGYTRYPANDVHQAHMQAGPLRGPIACDECHVTPASMDSHEPMGRQVTVTFGALARTGGAKPTWSWVSETCAGTYCHGSFAGGNDSTPVWSPENDQAACGSCHGLPPGGAHPASQGEPCATCHPDTVKPDGTIDVAGGKHIDGVVEVFGAHPAGWSDPTAHGAAADAGLAACTTCHGETLTGGTAGVSCDGCHASGWRTDCTFCHGDPSTGVASPPADVAGGTETTLVTVGAHASHVGSTLSAPLGCDECHVVPTDALSPGHLDGRPAELTFGATATLGGASPSWNRTAATCADTYCHGNFTNGAHASPVWTRVDGSQRACNFCHWSKEDGAATAPGQHGMHVVTRGFDCSTCHPGYSAASRTVNVSTHLDGTKEVKPGAGTWDGTNCASTGCHGTRSWY